MAAVIIITGACRCQRTPIWPIWIDDFSVRIPLCSRMRFTTREFQVNITRIHRHWIEHTMVKEQMCYFTTALLSRAIIIIITHTHHLAHQHITPLYTSIYNVYSMYYMCHTCVCYCNVYYVNDPSASGSAQRPGTTMKHEAAIYHCISRLQYAACTYIYDVTIRAYIWYACDDKR